MICVGVDLDSSLKSLNIANKFQQIFSSVGYHPHESKDANKNYLEKIEHLSTNKKVVAIGEMGLDYYYNHSKKNIQKKIFKEQLELAKTLNMPAIIHCRDAEKDLISCIKEIDINKGVVHCFSGSQNFADEIFKQGLLISLTGMITFNKNLMQVVKNIPLENMMLETDSPYLTPVPYRGKRNQPSMVKIIADKISTIKDESVNKIASITTDNAERLFKI